MLRKIVVLLTLVCFVFYLDGCWSTGELARGSSPTRELEFYTEVVTVEGEVVLFKDALWSVAVVNGADTLTFLCMLEDGTARQIPLSQVKSVSMHNWGGITTEGHEFKVTFCSTLKAKDPVLSVVFDDRPGDIPLSKVRALSLEALITTQGKTVTLRPWSGALVRDTALVGFLYNGQLKEIPLSQVKSARFSRLNVSATIVIATMGTAALVGLAIAAVIASQLRGFGGWGNR